MCGKINCQAFHCSQGVYNCIPAGKYAKLNATMLIHAHLHNYTHTHRETVLWMCAWR